MSKNGLRSVLLVTVVSGRYCRPLDAQLRPNDKYSEHRPQEQRGGLRREAVSEE